MELKQFILRVVVALIAGMAIGLEREIHHKNAGIRTNGLVSLGSAIFVLLSYGMIQDHGGDITRIIGQVVTGVGFLCAGVIMHRGGNPQGLTTAATVWCSAGIGCMAAAGYFAETAIACGIVLFVNGVMHVVDDWIDKRSKKSPDLPK
ncbi:MAG: MgtC/SapB family protein [Chitinophagales bacterium]